MNSLHMYSCYSETGTHTPTELVRMCATQGISIMSITDSNCVKANKEAELAARKAGIAYVSGAEFDCVFDGRNYKLLAYGMNYLSDDFKELEEYIDSIYYQVSLEMLQRTQELGFQVTENNMWEISKNQYYQVRWTGELFAKAIFSNPKNYEHPLLIPYQVGGARSDYPYKNFSQDFYTEGKYCHVKIDYPEMEEIIDIVHKNGGIVVLPKMENDLLVLDPQAIFDYIEFLPGNIKDILKGREKAFMEYLKSKISEETPYFIHKSTGAFRACKNCIKKY